MRGLGLRVWGVGFRVQGLRFCVWGLGFRVGGLAGYMGLITYRYPPQRPACSSETTSGSLVYGILQAKSTNIWYMGVIPGILICGTWGSSGILIYGIWGS